MAGSLAARCWIVMGQKSSLCHNSSVKHDQQPMPTLHSTQQHHTTLVSLRAKPKGFQILLSHPFDLVLSSRCAAFAICNGAAAACACRTCRVLL
jgi:hypothetical protein